jgi:hypothetical protein
MSYVKHFKLFRNATLFLYLSILHFIAFAMSLLLSFVIVIKLSSAYIFILSLPLIACSFSFCIHNLHFPLH